MIRLALFFPLVFAFWWVATPIMSAGVAHTAAGVLELCDWHDLTKKVYPQNDRIFVFFAPSDDNKPLNANYRRISYSFVFLVALIMAVPDVRPKLRLKILLIGLAIIFPIQVFRLVVWVLNYYGQHMTSHGEPLYPTFYRQALYYTDEILIRIDGHFIPVFIWAALFFYYQWFYEFAKKTGLAKS